MGNIIDALFAAYTRSPHLLTNRGRLEGFQLVRPEPPPVNASESVRTAIDSFILHQLEQRELRYSPLADKTTLVRRAYLDLLGIPPTPEQIDAFMNDNAPDAWNSINHHWSSLEDGNAAGTDSGWDQKNCLSGGLCTTESIDDTIHG